MLKNIFAGNSVRQKSTRGALLTIANFGIQNGLRLGGNLILTRILFPEAFGAMALLNVVLAGLNMFSDLGIRASIVQHSRGAEPLFLDTAWTIQIIRGFVLWGITCAIAGPLSSFYEAPILADLLPVAGLTLVFQGLNSTAIASASRNLTLGRLSFIEVGSSTIGLVAVIFLAISWGNVWALAIGSLVSPFFTMVLSHFAIPGHNNRFRFERESAYELIRFGKYLLLSTLAGFLILQLDKAVIAKSFSLVDLSMYHIAFMFASIPIVVLKKLNDMILFPLYSRLPPNQSRENFCNIAKARIRMNGFSMLLLGLLSIFGDHFIQLIYDPRYESAGILVVWLAIGLLPTIVTANYGSMMLAAGDSGKYAILMIFNAVVRTACLFFGIFAFGITGAALAPLFATICYYPVLVWRIRPYGGWIPMQDVLFGVASCAFIALAISNNYDAIKASLNNFPF